MTPEEKQAAHEAVEIFATHHRGFVGLLGCVNICMQCRVEWPCKAIKRARELTAYLSEEVD